MPQVSLYVDEETMSQLRADSKREGLSLSKYVARRLREPVHYSTANGLPEGWLDDLYGCLADDDSFEMPPRYEAEEIPPLEIG